MYRYIFLWVMIITVPHFAIASGIHNSAIESSIPKWNVINSNFCKHESETCKNMTEWALFMSEFCIALPGIQSSFIHTHSSCQKKCKDWIELHKNIQNLSVEQISDFNKLKYEWHGALLAHGALLNDSRCSATHPFQGMCDIDYTNFDFIKTPFQIEKGFLLLINCPKYQSQSQKPKKIGLRPFIVLGSLVFFAYKIYSFFAR